MSNTISVTDKIAAEMSVILEGKTAFLNHIDTRYKKEFTGEFGDTIRVRKPPKFTVSTSNTFSAQAYEDSTADLAIDKHAAVYLSFTELQELLTMKSAQERARVLDPMMASLASAIEKGILSTSYLTVANQVGTPGTAPASLSDVVAAKNALIWQGVSEKDKFYGLMNPDDDGALVAGTSALYNSQKVLAKQFEQGIVASLGGVDFLAPSIHLPQHTVGAYTGTPLVDGAAQTGTTLSIKGFGASITGCLKAGDIITLAGVYQVTNPTGAASHTSTSKLAQFVVAADANSDGSGDCDVTLANGGIIITGKNQNASAAAADEAAVTVISGATGTKKDINLVWNRNAFTAVFVPQKKIKACEFCSISMTNQVSIRFTQSWDYESNTNNIRVEADYGSLSLRPELAVRFHG